MSQVMSEQRTRAAAAGQAAGGTRDKGGGEGSGGNGE